MNVSSSHHISEATMKSEADIISLCRTQPEKFELLYNKYFTKIFRFVYQRLDNKNVAADITQQTFLKALSSIDKYTFKGVPFVSWLYRIAFNELQMHFRKHASDRCINLNDYHINSIIQESGTNEAEIKDRDAKLQKALQSLSPEDLCFVEMRFFEDRPFKEIAEILDITENNAKVKTYRILEKLKSILVKVL